MSQTIYHECDLEIDHARGVIYVHGRDGQTMLRIQGLPTPIPDPHAGDVKPCNMLDVNYGENVMGQQMVSWRKY